MASADEEGEIPTYRVEFAEPAEAELDAAYLFLSQRSLSAADRWFRGIRSAVASLSQFPRRCAIASEDAEYSAQEVRHLIFGSGRSAYRIITKYPIDRGRML